MDLLGGPNRFSKSGTAIKQYAHTFWPTIIPNRTYAAKDAVNVFTSHSRYRLACCLAECAVPS